jgi:hypothetical protein
MDDPGGPPSTDDGPSPGGRARLLPRLGLLALLAVVVGLLVPDRVLGLGIIVGVQALTLVPELVRWRRRR